jgi:hypothetical protein
MEKATMATAPVRRRKRSKALSRMLIVSLSFRFSMEWSIQGPEVVASVASLQHYHGLQINRSSTATRATKM